jgi:hypothetical protein
MAHDAGRSAPEWPVPGGEFAHTTGWFGSVAGNLKAFAMNLRRKQRHNGQPVGCQPGKAMMGTGTGTGTASGLDRATKAADLTVAPLLEGIDLSGARGVLVLIAAAKGRYNADQGPDCGHPATVVGAMGDGRSGPCFDAAGN